MYNWCTLTSILLVSILILCESAPQGGDNLPDDKEIKRASNVGGESSDSDAFLVVNNDGSYDHGHQNRDRGAAYHFAQANARNVVRGRFGSRSPANGRIQETAYTAGPRGFRPRGENIHRKYDLSQAGPVRPIGNKDDPYFDPSEDPSYSFGFRTSTYTRQEDQNRIGDVTGRYTFIDDIGERHNVEYIAGARTGFHIHTPYPDSNPPPYGPLYFSGPGKKPRGHTSVQRNLDGSYRYVAQGPDQRKTETKDSSGVVRGSYTYLDDKGKQRSVYYIAGPGIGYRVLKNAKDYNVLYPFSKNPPISSPLPQLKPEVNRPPRPGQSPADSVGDGDGDGEDIPQSVLDDILFNGPKENLNTAASGYEKPKPGSPTSPGASFGTGPGVTGGGDFRPQEVPSGPSFGGPGVSGSEFRPTQEGAGFPSTSFGTGPGAGSGFRPQPTGNGFPKPKPPQFGINGGAGAGSGTTGSGFPDSSGTRPDFPETGSGFPKPGAGGTRPSSGETGFAGFQPTNPAAQFGAGTGPDGNGFGSGEDKPFKPKPPGSGEKLPGGSSEKPGFDFDSNSIGGSDQDEDGGYPKPPSNQFGSSGETGLIPGAPSRPGTAGQSGSRPIDQKPFGSSQGRPSTDGDEYDDKYDTRPKPSRPFGQDGGGQSKPSRPAGGGAGQGLPEDSSASETDMYGSGGDDYGSGQDTGAGFQKPKPDGGAGGFGGSGGSSEFGSGGNQGSGSQFEGAGGLDNTGGGQFGSGAGRPGGTQFGGASPDQEGSQFGGGGGGTSQGSGSQFGGSGRPSTPQGGGRPAGTGGRPQGAGGRPQGSGGGRPGGGAGGRPQGGGGRPPGTGGRPGGGSGSGRPSQTGDFGDEEDVDVFGEGPVSRPISGNEDKYRPSGDKPSSQEKPSSGGQFTGTIGISTDTGESGDFDNKRPIVTVSEEDSDYDVFNSGGGGRPSGDRPPGGGGGRPTGDRPQGGGGRPPGTGGRPGGGRPSGGRPSGGIRPGGVGVDTDEGYSRPMHGTILRNLGDETIGIRPGVSVRAHVQQIDLLPYGSRVPSPGEQLNKDIKNNE